MVTLDTFFIRLAVLSFVLFIVYEGLLTLQELEPGKDLYTNTKLIKVNTGDIEPILVKDELDSILQLNSSATFGKQPSRNLDISCPVANCKICDESLHCKICNEGFKIEGKNCVSSKKKNNSSDKKWEIIITIAFSSLPLFFFIVCCFFCLHLRQRNRIAQSRREFSQNIMLEVRNNLRAREAESIRLNQLSSSAEEFISSESNLVINSENFAVRFPAIDAVSELMPESCTICFDQLDNNTTLRITPCGHIFHHKCLYEWLITNEQARCPNDNIKLS